MRLKITMCCLVFNISSLDAMETSHSGDEAIVMNDLQVPQTTSSPPQPKEGATQRSAAFLDTEPPSDPKQQSDDVVVNDKRVLGWADHFFTALLRCLRIGQGPIDLLAVLTTGAAALLNLTIYVINTSETLLSDGSGQNMTFSPSPLNATAPSSAQNHTSKLNAAAALVGGIATGSQLLRAYWQKAINDDQRILEIVKQDELQAENITPPVKKATL